MPTEKQQVLIAEDNPGLARVLSFKFKSCGFDPITCGNGGEAWKSFCDSRVVAVVSDHEMPIMSGVELISRIREMDSKIPCFLVTGRQLELARDPRVLKLNISEVFGNPFSPGTVVSAVSAAIEKNAPSSPAVATPSTDSSPGTSALAANSLAANSLAADSLTGLPPSGLSGAGA